MTRKLVVSLAILTGMITFLILLKAFEPVSSIALIPFFILIVAGWIWPVSDESSARPDRSKPEPPERTDWAKAKETERLARLIGVAPEVVDPEYRPAPPRGAAATRDPGLVSPEQAVVELTTRSESYAGTVAPALAEQVARMARDRVFQPGQQKNRTSEQGSE